jgi:hypothetical protein
MLYAAVRSGADAVYLGAKDFSARRNAENFSIDELKTVVEYCHIRDVQVYLTLNILIKDAELSDAINLAVSAYNAGIDGSVVIEKIKNSRKVGYGFDAYKEVYCDMIASGIVDPTKVTRTALQNAASIASMVLTTESVVADKKEPAFAAPAMNPGDMGMY